MCYGVVQDSGTAIWLFAYFGYWLEVIFVLSVRAARGTLLQSKKRPQPAEADLPQLNGAKQVRPPDTPLSPDPKLLGELLQAPHIVRMPASSVSELITLLSSRLITCFLCGMLHFKIAWGLCLLWGNHGSSSLIQGLLCL